MRAPCGDPACAAYMLTVGQFVGLAGRPTDQSLKIRMGLKAKERYAKHTGKKQRRDRNNASRNKLARYPCGLLEQIYREITGEPSFKRRDPFALGPKG